jgi:hypothetical protein
MKGSHMTNEARLLDALMIIAAIPLWGERIKNPEHGDKNELAQRGEYDLGNDAYEPCCDAEADWLGYAVETARETLAFIAYRDAVDIAMKQSFRIDAADAGIEDDLIARAKADGESAQDFALRFGEIYGLTLVSDWQFR